jgi:hypothetical protein
LLRSVSTLSVKLPGLEVEMSVKATVAKCLFGVALVLCAFAAAFVEGWLEAPKHLARTVHDLYFAPKYEEFLARTIWSLSNAFTSAFKELDPIPPFEASAKLGQFLESRFTQSF